MDIKEIALKVWYAKNECMPADGMDKLSEFAEALVAEIQRRGEPVACADKDSFEWHIKNSPETSFGIWTTSDWKRKLNLPDQKPILFFTFPPSIEELENKVAEACAAMCKAMPDVISGPLRVTNGPYECSEAIRSGEWRKFLKGE